MLSVRSARRRPADPRAAAWLDQVRARADGRAVLIARLLADRVDPSTMSVELDPTVVRLLCHHARLTPAGLRALFAELAAVGLLDPAQLDPGSTWVRYTLTPARR